MVKKGIAASPGISIGAVFLLENKEVVIDTTAISEAIIENEIGSFYDAKIQTKKQLEEIKAAAQQSMGEDEAEIFQAHLLVLDDPMLEDKVIENIRIKKLNAVASLDAAVKELSSMLENLADEYMRERAADIKDVGRRLLYNLAGIEMVSLSDFKKEVVIVAKDLTPSDTAQMNLNKVLGFVTDVGGRTAHTSIMARSLELPAVVGTKDATAWVKDGDIIIVDGLEGYVILNPTEEERQKYQQKRAEYLKEKEELKKTKDLAAITKDGRKVEISANIGTPKDVEGAMLYGAEGIGLYRSEFLYMDRNSLPSEDEQFAAYKEVVEKMKERPIIIRTLDIGGDKELPYINFPAELNPFLGWRAIRMCLDRPEILKTQVRAILRASNYGNPLIMYPMIISVSEIKSANALLYEAKTELKNEKVPFNENIKVGMMVETPASAVMADKLVEMVDFFSIGTNDLTQYTLAVDRGNEKIANLYQPLHPGVLRLIKQVIDASHEGGKWTGMCGELAGDPMATMVLLGLGLDEFSMSASSIPSVKKLIRMLNYSDAQEIAEAAINMSSPEEVITYLNSKMRELL